MGVCLILDAHHWYKEPAEQDIGREQLSTLCSGTFV
jgi:hypothetical protein